MQAVIDILSGTQVAVSLGGLILLGVYESMHPFFDFYQQKKDTRTKHFVRNLAVGAVNAMVIVALFSGLWLWATVWASDQNVGLFNWLDTVMPGIPTWARLIGVILLFDLWMYLWHRINHKVPFLWRFHKVHHADPFMDVSTATRFHIGEIILSSIFRIFVLIALGMHLWELLAYEIIAIGVIQFHHANIQIPEKMDRWLRQFIVTPSIHKVHHSNYQLETDSNYGTIFTFWDRMLRTLRIRKDQHKIQLGLEEYAPDEEQRLSDLFKMPFDKTQK
ncbi:MAG: sterol desaturase family protein [Balneolaceae bacterium]|nr:sterol desaturase family protein [Balneolaceae bacterium]